MRAQCLCVSVCCEYVREIVVYWHSFRACVCITEDPRDLIVKIFAVEDLVLANVNPEQVRPHVGGGPHDEGRRDDGESSKPCKGREQRPLRVCASAVFAASRAYAHAHAGYVRARHCRSYRPHIDSYLLLAALMRTPSRPAPLEI